MWLDILLLCLQKRWLAFSPSSACRHVVYGTHKKYREEAGARTKCNAPHEYPDFDIGLSKTDG